MLDTTRHNLSRQPNTSDPPRRRRESSHTGTVTGKGAATANCDLQRSQYAPPVDRPGPGCRGRVQLGKPAVQFGGALGLFKLRGHLGPLAGHFEAVDKRVHVKAGTANEKGALTREAISAMTLLDSVTKRATSHASDGSATSIK